MLHTWISQKGFNYYLMASQKMIITFGLVDIIFFLLLLAKLYTTRSNTHTVDMWQMMLIFFFFFENDKWWNKFKHTYIQPSNYLSIIISIFALTTFAWLFIFSNLWKCHLNNKSGKFSRKKRSNPCQCRERKWRKCSVLLAAEKNINPWMEINERLTC